MLSNESILNQRHPQEDLWKTLMEEHKSTFSLFSLFCSSFDSADVMERLQGESQVPRHQTCRLEHLRLLTTYRNNYSQNWSGLCLDILSPIILMLVGLAFQRNFSLSYFSDGILLLFLLLINVDFGFLPLLYWDCLLS